MKKFLKKNIFKIRFEIFFLVFLFVILILFRIAKLKTAPRTIMIDEASHAYIAYSLLKTGKDEHGQSWPIIFKAFGDQKLPAYAYSLIPFLAVLPLEPWVVRLPSVISGILFVLVIFYLLKELKFNKKEAIFAASIAAFSSWTFMLSRFAYESNLALLFFTSALLFFLKAGHLKKNIYYFLFALFSALSVYSYISYRLIMPVFFFLIFILSFFKKSQDNLKKNKIFSSFIVFLLLILPIFFLSNLDNSLARFNQVGFLSDQGMVLEIDEKRTFCATDYPRFVCDLIWNKGTFFVKKIFSAYLYLFSPNYLFLEGDNDLAYMNVDSFGQFSFLLLPFYLLAIVSLFKTDAKKKDQFLKLFLIIAFLITPLPAVLSGLQKVRLSPVLPFFIIFFTWGFREFLSYFKKDKVKNLVFILITLLLPIHFLLYFINFASIHLPKNIFAYDGYVPKIFSIAENYVEEDKVVYIEAFFSDPIMYYAFYQKIDPSHYQENVKLAPLEKSGFQHAQALDDYVVVHSLAEAIELAEDSEREVVYISNKQALSKNYILENIWVSDPAIVYAQVYDLSKYILEEENEKIEIN